MSSKEDGGQTAVAQLNADLRLAQLDLLSAQCATDRLRLRYSPEDIARHAQRDTLRKACSSASALHEYYSSLARQLQGPDGMEKSSSMNEAKLEDAIVRVADFWRAQRELFRPDGLPLDRDQRQAMKPFFSASLLEQVRIVSLHGQRVQNPPFYTEARAIGIKYLPEMTDMASLTFEDVLVFQGAIATRTLFRALVHVVQFQVLGLARYTELFVRGFLRTGAHARVPLENHALLLESEFAASKAKSFSVEERVRLWTNQNRY